jgi:o-succinylbenzoate synthase
VSDKATTLQGFTLTDYALRLRRPLVTARGPVAVREGLVLAITAADGSVGLGEAAPLPGFTSETLPQVRAAIERALAPLVGGPLPRFAATIRALVRVQDLPPCAAHAVDQALLDLAARRRGVSAAKLMRGGARSWVFVSRLIEVPEEAAAADAEGILIVKMKVGARSLAADLDRVQAARVAAPDVAIRLDANGAWTFEQAAEAIELLAQIGVECLEDPVPDLADMARLRGRGVAIAADGPVRDEAGLEAVIAAGAADAIVIKPMFCGGLTAASALLARAARARLPGIVTTALEGAIGRAGALHVAAASPGALWPCGLDTGRLLLSDIARGPEVSGGAIAITGPGLGVEADL